MLETLLNDGFGYHATEPERLARELEAAAAEARAEPALWPQFLRVSTHTIGEHLGDWPRAVRLGEAVLKDQAPAPETARAWAHLSVARLLAGDGAGTAEAELAFLAASGEDFRGALIEARFLLVAALVGCERTAEASAIYQAALALARQLGDAAPHRAIAVASNNLASDILEAPDRTAEEAALMRLAAETAHEHWRKCGTWVNDERAHYLQAMVANVLGEPRRALDHVDAALAIIAANGDEPIDVTFFHLTRAHAYKLLGDADASARSLAQSDADAAAWEDAGLKSWYAGERARVMG
jgi:tetratricopeptide (TPR) repeat protein